MGILDTLIRLDTLIFQALGLNRHAVSKEVEIQNVYTNKQ